MIELTQVNVAMHSSRISRSLQLNKSVDQSTGVNPLGSADAGPLDPAACAGSKGRAGAGLLGPVDAGRWIRQTRGCARQARCCWTGQLRRSWAAAGQCEAGEREKKKTRHPAHNK